MKRALGIVVTALVSATGLAGQGVMIAPHAVFIARGARSGSVTLMNPDTAPVEVSVEVFYGYTATDSAGQLMLRTVEHPDSTQPSAAAWLQAFPRRLTIAPREQQVVRLLATPPAGLPDGEYWARLAFTAKAGQLPVEGVTDTANVKVGLTLQVRTVIGVHYRAGVVRTGLSLSGLRAERHGDSVVVHARLERAGNAAYLGTVHGTVVGPGGRSVGEFRVPVTVFFANEPRWAVAIGSVPAARYLLRLEVTTDRDDLSQDVMLPFPVVRDSVEVAAL
jgi:P pilus assembly chaperone PapD